VVPGQPIVGPGWDETITDSLPTTSDLATSGGGPRWKAPRWLVDELRREPRHWFHAERTNLAAAVRAAGANGLHRQAWQIAGSMASPCLLYGDYDILAGTLDVARQVCQRGNDAVGEATMLAAAGRLRQELCDLDGAYQLFQEAFCRFDAADEARGQAFAAIFTADTLRALQQRGNGSDFAEAGRWGMVARGLREKLGDIARMVDAGYVLGKIFVAQGRLAAAQDSFRTVLALGEQLNKPIVRAHALFQLGRNRTNVLSLVRSHAGVQRSARHREECGRSPQCGLHRLRAGDRRGGAGRGRRRDRTRRASDADLSVPASRGTNGPSQESLRRADGDTGLVLQPAVATWAVVAR
jgi:hypothetical protein